MPRRRRWRLPLWSVSILVGINVFGVSAAAPAPPGAVRISGAVVGQPLVAGRIVLWSEPVRRDTQPSIPLPAGSGAPPAIEAGTTGVFPAAAPRTAIRGYDLDTNTPFAVATRLGAVLDLAAAAGRAAWVERDAEGYVGITSADLRTGAVSRILTFPGHPASSTVALDQNTLYYVDPTPGHTGLFARDLTTGFERLVSTNGQRPVARGGALLWTEARPAGVRGRWLWSLHLQTAAGRRIVLAERAAGYRGLAGYDVDGERVVWAFEASSGDARVYLYDTATEITTVVPSSASAAPHIRGRSVVWPVASVGPGQPPRWLVQSYDLETGALQPIVDASSAALTVAGIAGTELVLAVADNTEEGLPTLYASDMRMRGVRFATLPSAAAVRGSCDPVRLICGQVRAAGATLVDDGGAWRMQGVQFFLPQFGINSKTFRTGDYAAALSDRSLDFWLGKAQDYLRANTLRIFVEMPYRDSNGALVTPTDYATLFDFAARARARGMRLAVSLHNSADWTMSAERASWITGLIDYFAARGGLETIAYFSADNEINNHCGRAGADCFDSDAGYDAGAYVDGAIGWVARFREVVKSRAPQILVTVGVSTEVRDVDQTRGALNFFRADSQGRTLASLVDLLAPHNYAGGAAAVVDDIRHGGYAGPVILEEFGYPTDPYPRGTTWTEGAPVCRADPTLSQCAMTAPFFVETNIQALRLKSYAGAAAWMLADMREKDTASACADPSKPFDLWTGLFAVGGTYCAGGTYSRALGQPKATAVRVCAYYADNLALCEPGVPLQPRLYFPLVRR